VKESLVSALKKLRLSGLLECLEVRLHEARSHGLTHSAAEDKETRRGGDKETEDGLLLVSLSPCLLVC
jgi:hypothetical protein